ncbi:phosphoribosylanthranilate isomerase [bacterium]|nr:phosphoribosylanthranilate isomerase [bacterium]
MKLYIKICGITTAGDAVLAEQSGASAVGFIFYPPSPRAVAPEKAAEISRSLGPFITRVGVFVDEDPDVVLETVRTAHLSAVQLHGSESPGYIGQLQGIPVIKAFRVGPDFDHGILGRYTVSAYLLDAFHEDAYGGTGKTFDWDKAAACRHYGKIILAGGLNADNIGNALKVVNPWGVDISSGIEQRPGKKDPEKMKALFNAITRELTR